jgi:hypothetical protein
LTALARDANAHQAAARAGRGGRLLLWFAHKSGAIWSSVSASLERRRRRHCRYTARIASQPLIATTGRLRAKHAVVGARAGEDTRAASHTRRVTGHGRWRERRGGRGRRQVRRKDGPAMTQALQLHWHCPESGRRRQWRQRQRRRGLRPTVRRRSRVRAERRGGLMKVIRGRWHCKVGRRCHD